jgi:hypothetical protein
MNDVAPGGLVPPQCIGLGTPHGVLRVVWPRKPVPSEGGYLCPPLVTLDGKPITVKRAHEILRGMRVSLVRGDVNADG